LKAGGKMLIAADMQMKADGINSLFEKFGLPAQVTVSAKQPLDNLAVKPVFVDDLSKLADASFDDILYFGSNCDTATMLFSKLAPKGIINFVQCGKKFASLVTAPVGRVHYGGIRVIGTTGHDPCEAMEKIPVSGEVKSGAKLHVIGAGGPMGVMHVIRNICQGIENLTVFASDLDDARLAALDKISKPLAHTNGVKYISYNSKKNTPDELYDYAAIMAPVPAIVADSIKKSRQGGIINIFAGIPASVAAQIDMDTYIERYLYMIGTSGSVLEDMKTVLAKVEAGSLDTNLSVAAISGLDGAIEGIRAVEKALIPGKIIVYPQCAGLGLTPLCELEKVLPGVAKELSNGCWTKKAEDTLIEIYTRKVQQ